MTRILSMTNYAEELKKTDIAACFLKTDMYFCIII